MSASIRPLPPRLLTALLCAVLFAGSVLLFSRAADYGFSNYDDPSYVTNNPHVRGGLTWSGVVWAFTAPTDYWHPLTWLSHMIDWQWFGDDAYGHHVTSLVWHGANAVLVFLVFRRLTGAYWTSAFCAALFAWHPLRVESVVWITERKDVMSGCFFLLTLGAYARYAARRAHGKDLPDGRTGMLARAFPTDAASWRAYALTLVCFLAGLMSKPMLVSVPLVLLILDAWPLRRLPPGQPLWRRWIPLLIEKLPLVVLSAAVSVATVLFQRHYGAFVLELPLGARLGNAFVSIARYLGKFFRPVDLTVFYPHPGYWPALTVAVAFLLTLLLTALAWRGRRRWPALLAGWLMFLVMLLPALGLVQVGAQAMADRYTYLPILGLQLALLWPLRDLAAGRSARRLLSVAAALTLGFCSVRTWDQQATWRDTVTLFQHSVAVEDRNEIGHALLAYTLLGLDRAAEAEHHAQRALELNPANDTALATLAELRERQGRLAEAEAAYRASLASRPGHERTRYALGRLLLRMGRTEEGVAELAGAIRDHPANYAAHLALADAESARGGLQPALAFYRAALVVQPDDVAVHVRLGRLLQVHGDEVGARTHLETALELDPNHAPAKAELGLLSLAQGDAGTAARYLREAVAERPDLALAHLGLARAAERLGDPAEATRHFAHALRLAPQDAVVHRAWADTLARRREFTPAITHYERAIELDPRDAESHAALGYLLLFTGRRAEARARWEEALRLQPDFTGLQERLQQLR